MKTNFFKAAFLAAFFLPLATTCYGQWSVTGNAGTNPTTNFLGTTDAQALLIKTGGIERMRIAANGVTTLGRGEDNVFGLFTVQTKQASTMYNPGRTASFLLNSSLSTPGNIIPCMRLNFNDIGPFLGSGFLNGSYYYGGSWKTYFSVGSTGNMVVGDHTGLPLSGYGLYVVKNVIIGTASSTGTMLAVNGNSTFSGTTLIGGAATFSSTTSFGGNATFSGTTSFAGASSFSNTVSIGSVPSKPAGYGLFVADGILTEKVKVAIKTTANWSDFVFAKDYQLPSLDQVEQYINKNHHLAGIPSAEEVVKDGIDIAQMDAKLLMKVEELTLYVIELKKEIEAIKAAR